MSKKTSLMIKIVKYMSPTGSESMDDRATVDAV